MDDVATLDRSELIIGFFTDVDRQAFDEAGAILADGCEISAPGYAGAGRDAVVGWIGAFYAGFGGPDARPNGSGGRR